MGMKKGVLVGVLLATIIAAMPAMALNLGVYGQYTAYKGNIAIFCDAPNMGSVRIYATGEDSAIQYFFNYYGLNSINEYGSYVNLYANYDNNGTYAQYSVSTEVYNGTMTVYDYFEGCKHHISTNGEYTGLIEGADAYNGTLLGAGWSLYVTNASMSEYLKHSNTTLIYDMANYVNGDFEFGEYALYYGIGYVYVYQSATVKGNTTFIASAGIPCSEASIWQTSYAENGTSINEVGAVGDFAFAAIGFVPFNSGNPYYTGYQIITAEI